MYNANQLRLLFQNKFNLQDWNKFVLDVIKPQTYRQKPEQLDIDPAEGQGYFLGQKHTTDNFDIALFYLRLNRSVTRRRVGLRQLLAKYLRFTADAALVVFDDGDNWRLSFICDLKDERTQPKRYTFVFGEQTNYYNTAVKRFVDLQGQGITFETLKDAFSVEALTKEFYEKLYNWYLWAVDNKSGVTFPNKTETDTDDRENINRKMIRLITRMLFVWFIKQKHLVPNNIFEEEYLSKILRDFDPKAKESGITIMLSCKTYSLLLSIKKFQIEALHRTVIMGKAPHLRLRTCTVTLKNNLGLHSLMMRKKKKSWLSSKIFHI